MNNIQNLMLQELRQQSEVFCQEHLARFYQQFEQENGGISAVIELEDSNNSLRRFVREKRSKALYKRFESAFLEAQQNTQLKFDQLLSQADVSRPVTNVLDRVIESELALPNMVLTANRCCDDELNDLNRRLSVICRIKIVLERNPFSPITYACAFEQAIVSLQWKMQTRALAFRLFESTFMEQLNSLYHDMNHSLCENGILSNLLPHCSEQGEELEYQQRCVAEAEDIELNERTTASRIRSVAQPIEALSKEATFFDAANDARQLKHIRAIETVGQSFNELLKHEGLTPGLKSLLSRLYSPYVRLALSDESLAENRNHPAQRLLASIKVALQLYQCDDTPLQRPAVFLQIRNLVDQLSNHAEVNPRVFSEQAFRFSAELRHQERLVSTQLDKKKRCQTGIRQLESLKLSIRRIIASKMEHTQIPLSPLVSEFMFTTWTQYTTSLYANPATNLSESEQALAMVGRVLKYSAGKSHSSAEDFDEIAPDIRKGILACGGEGLEVRQFLQQLMHQHKNPITDSTTVGAKKTATEAATR